MSPEAKRLIKEYQKEWRAKNKDKVKRNAEAYWERKAQQTQGKQ